MKQRFWIVFTLIWSLALMGSARAAQEQTLSLFFTGDTHNRLEPYKDPSGDSVGGVVRRARYLAQARAQNPMSLLLDAGDVFQGTPYYNMYLGEPDIQAMNLMGYNAMCVGNHEFDNGYLNLRKQTDLAFFPVLNANIFDAQTGLRVFRPYHVFQVQGLKVAVMGMMSDYAWQAVARENKKGYRLRDPISVAKELVPKLRPHVDLIISLHHMGINDDEKYAREVPGVDVIIGGHTHTQMDHAKLIKNNNDNGLGGTLIQHSFTKGKFVGRIDLNLDVHHKIKSYHSELVRMDARFDQRPVETLLESYGKQLKADMNQVIGRSSADMLTEGKYKGSFTLGSLMADIIREHAQAEVGIMNTGGVRTDLLKGPITVGNIFEIMPFDNAITAFNLPGSALRKIVETNASRLGDRKTVQFSGLVYTLQGKKVVGITVNGQPLKDRQIYRVAAPDYVFAGNEGHDFKAATQVSATGELIRDVMLEYVRAKGQIDPPTDQRIIRQGAK